LKILKPIFLTAIEIIFLFSLVRCTADPLIGSDKVKIRWFVGLEIGSDFSQLEVLEKVSAEFNESQDEIELQLEVATIAGAYDLFAINISTGNGPDIVGPISWGMASGFPEQWLDLGPYLAASNFDRSGYDTRLLAFYQTVDGQILSLPFSISPAALYFIPAMFDELGLPYPPQVYGASYELDGRNLPWNWNTLAKVAQRLTVDAHNYNANQPQFDRNQIVQVGFHPQRQSMTSFATFWGAAKMFDEDDQGQYVSTIPDEWKAAWRWWHDGIWNEQPYIAPVPLSQTIEFGEGEVFYAGKAAIALGQAADLCCLTRFRDRGLKFQLGVLPADASGNVNSHISETSFYIWQGTTHPDEAFTVLTYLLTHESAKLLLAYDAMSADINQVGNYIARKSQQYPTVSSASWQVLVQGLQYPDIPSADQYLPNRNQALDRLENFGAHILITDIDDFDAEFRQLQDDLTSIYNK